MNRKLYLITFYDPPPPTATRRGCGSMKEMRKF